MDLVWLVYGISLLTGIGTMLGVAIVISICCMIFLLGYRGMECTQEDFYGAQTNQKRAEKGKWAMGHVKTSLIVFITSSVLLTFLPSEKTAYMLVGAYAAQKIAENDKVQETGSKVLAVINQKLDTYIEEGIEKAEKAAKSKK
jgi:MFS superfamily sulfate permease-like transporter